MRMRGCRRFACRRGHLCDSRDPGTPRRVAYATLAGSFLVPKQDTQEPSASGIPYSDLAGSLFGTSGIPRAAAGTYATPGYSSGIPQGRRGHLCYPRDPMLAGSLVSGIPRDSLNCVWDLSHNSKGPTAFVTIPSQGIHNFCVSGGARWRY